MPYTVYCILCYCKLYTAWCILFTVYCIMCTVWCILVYCVLYTAHCVLCFVCCILYTVYCILYIVHCILHAVYRMSYTVYCVFKTALAERMFFSTDTNKTISVHIVCFVLYVLLRKRLLRRGCTLSDPAGLVLSPCASPESRGG
jgi:hypothetical protein